MQELLSGSYSNNYNWLLAEPNSGFRRTDAASTWLTSSMKTQHGHGLECAPKKMSCRDTLCGSKGGVETTLRWGYFIKCCLDARSEISCGETKSFPLISPSSHCLLQPVPADQWHLAGTGFTLFSAPFHDETQCWCSGAGYHRPCHAGTVPCERHPVPLRCLAKLWAQLPCQLQLG